MSEFVCTNPLMEKVESKTDIFQVCLTCKDNLICPLLNEDYEEELRRMNNGK